MGQDLKCNSGRVDDTSRLYLPDYPRIKPVCCYLYLLHYLFTVVFCVLLCIIIKLACENESGLSLTNDR